MSVSMRVKRTGTAIGHFLGLWCLGFGALNLVFFQSFAASGEPSRFSGEIDGFLLVVFSIVGGIALILLGGIIARFAGGNPSQVLGGWGLARLVLVLAFSVLASVRAVLGFGPAVSGEVGVWGVISEVWFTVAGVAGLALCAVLSVRRRQLQEHRERNVRR